MFKLSPHRPRGPQHGAINVRWVEGTKLLRVVYKGPFKGSDLMDHTAGKRRPYEDLTQDELDELKAAQAALGRPLQHA